MTLLQNQPVQVIDELMQVKHNGFNQSFLLEMRKAMLPDHVSFIEKCAEFGPFCKQFAKNNGLQDEWNLVCDSMADCRQEHTNMVVSFILNASKKPEKIDGKDVPDADVDMSVAFSSQGKKDKIDPKLNIIEEIEEESEEVEKKGDIIFDYQGEDAKSVFPEMNRKSGSTSDLLELVNEDLESKKLSRSSSIESLVSIGERRGSIVSSRRGSIVGGSKNVSRSGSRRSSVVDEGPKKIDQKTLAKTGTGGSPFMIFLKELKTDSLAAKI